MADPGNNRNTGHDPAARRGRGGAGRTVIIVVAILVALILVGWLLAGAGDGRVTEATTDETVAPVDGAVVEGDVAEPAEGEVQPSE